MPNAREFVTKWGFNIDHDKLDKVERQLDGIKGRLDAFLGLEAIKGLYELAERFSQVGLQMQVAATTAGTTVEAFQALAFAAKHSGASQEELQTSLRRLSLTIYKARMGAQDASLALSYLGVNTSGIKNGQEAMYILADRVRNIKDPIERAALVTQVLGRGSQHMVYFLSQGSKAMKEEEERARKLGIVLGTDEVNALAKMEHAFTNLKAVMDSFLERTASKLGPLVEHVIDLMLQWYQANRKLIESGVEEWLHKLAFGLGFAWGLFTDLVEVAKHFTKALNDNGISIIGLLKNLGEALVVIKLITIATGLWAAAFSPITVGVVALTLLLQQLEKIMEGNWKEGILSKITPLGFLARLGEVGATAFQVGQNSRLVQKEQNISTGFAAIGNVNQGAGFQTPLSDQIGNYTPQISITQHIGAGGSPMETGKEAASRTRDVLHQLLRETARDFSGNH